MAQNAKAMSALSSLAAAERDDRRPGSAGVLAGVVLLAAVAIFLRTPAFTRDHFAAVEAVAYYWHFVFVVWLALYATIFLIR